MNKSGQRGRRVGSPDTRAKILDAAGRRFLQDGYQHTTLRAVAGDVGVDVALISYFFGSKRGLFAAVFALVTNPAEILTAELGGDPITFPQRLIASLLTVWDDPVRGKPLVTMVRAAVADPAVAGTV